MNIKQVTLNNGIKMPILGYGVFEISNEQTERCVLDAIEVGYRSIDTAMIYGNEAGVGEGIKGCGVKRQDLFITSKLWNGDQGYDTTLSAFDDSLARLDLDYLDLYLIHWPVPANAKYVDTWKALEKLYADERIRAIGVSNFTIAHLNELKEKCDITPTVNQIELHPWLVQTELVDHMKQNGIYTEAWSPLGRGELLDDKALQSIADKYEKSIAQVILRWIIQRDIITIPKTLSKDRMIANLSIFDFELSEQDMNAITNMNKNYRTGPDPDTFNLLKLF